MYGNKKTTKSRKIAHLRLRCARHAHVRAYIYRGCFSPIIYYILNVFGFLCFLVSIVVFSLGVVGFEVATRFFILVSFCFRLVAVKLKERARALPLR